MHIFKADWSVLMLKSLSVRTLIVLRGESSGSFGVAMYSISCLGLIKVIISSGHPIAPFLSLPRFNYEASFSTFCIGRSTVAQSCGPNSSSVNMAQSIVRMSRLRLSIVPRAKRWNAIVDLCPILCTRAILDMISLAKCEPWSDTQSPGAVKVRLERDKNVPSMCW